MDSSVGGKVKLLLQRGGTEIEVELNVEDLHDITPDKFVEVAGGIFHDLSYQKARSYAVAVKGVYVCEAVARFRFGNIKPECIIESVDQKKTPDLKTFINVVKGLRDRARVVVTYRHLQDWHTVLISIVYVERHWTSEMRIFVRNDTTGVWDCEDIAEPLPAIPPKAGSAKFAQLESALSAPVSEVIQSFVRVSCLIPFMLDGLTS